jgi:hypothetical protein
MNGTKNHKQAICFSPVLGSARNRRTIRPTAHYELKASRMPMSV